MTTQTYAQNVANINRRIAADIRADALAGIGDETPYIAQPNHQYWKARMQTAAAELGKMQDEEQHEAFWDGISDTASAQQICKACEREIARLEAVTAARRARFEEMNY